MPRLRRCGDRQDGDRPLVSSHSGLRSHFPPSDPGSWIEVCIAVLTTRMRQVPREGCGVGVALGELDLRVDAAERATRHPALARLVRHSMKCAGKLWPDARPACAFSKHRRQPARQHRPRSCASSASTPARRRSTTHHERQSLSEQSSAYVATTLRCGCWHRPMGSLSWMRTRCSSLLSRIENTYMVCPEPRPAVRQRSRTCGERRAVPAKQQGAGSAAALMEEPR